MKSLHQIRKPRIPGPESGLPTLDLPSSRRPGWQVPWAGQAGVLRQDPIHGLPTSMDDALWTDRLNRSCLPCRAPAFYKDTTGGRARSSLLKETCRDLPEVSSQTHSTAALVSSIWLITDRGVPPGIFLTRSQLRFCMKLFVQLLPPSKLSQ